MSTYDIYIRYRLIIRCVLRAKYIQGFEAWVERKNGEDWRGGGAGEGHVSRAARRTLAARSVSRAAWEGCYWFCPLLVVAPLTAFVQRASKVIKHKMTENIDQNIFPPGWECKFDRRTGKQWVFVHCHRFSTRLSLVFKHCALFPLHSKHCVIVVVIFQAQKVTAFIIMSESQSDI